MYHHIYILYQIYMICIILQNYVNGNSVGRMGYVSPCGGNGSSRNASCSKRTWE